MKKFLSLLLTFAMVMSLAAPGAPVRAYAAEVEESDYVEEFENFEDVEEPETEEPEAPETEEPVVEETEEPVVEETEEPEAPETEEPEATETEAPEVTETEATEVEETEDEEEIEAYAEEAYHVHDDGMEFNEWNPVEFYDGGSWYLDGSFWVADAGISAIVNEKWTLPADMNLCLGHNTMWMDKTAAPFAGKYNLVVPNGVTLNIYGCEDDAEARIVGEHAGFLTVDGGTVNIYGASIVAEDAGKVIVNSGELNLYGGKITSDDALNGTTSDDCVLEINGGTVNLRGGAVESYSNERDFDNLPIGGMGVRVNGGKLNITGTSFDTDGSSIAVNAKNAINASGYNGAALSLTLEGTWADGDVIATGDAFEVEGAYVNKDGNLVVGEPIPEGHYHDGVLFQEWNPVDCYKGGNWLLDGDFWVADANIQSIVNEKWTLPADMNLCLGHNTLWMDKTGPFAGEYDIVVPAGITLNIYGCEDSAMARIVGEHAGFLTVDGGTVNVYGGKLVGEGDGQIIVNSGELNLIGGTITSDDGLNGTSSNDCVLVVKGGTVNISGGTVEATGMNVDFDTQEDVGATGIRVSGGKLNLTGAPAFKCEGADLEVNAANAVDADGYTGGKLTVKVGENLAAGDVVVSHAAEAAFEAEGAYVDESGNLVVGEPIPEGHYHDGVLFQEWNPVDCYKGGNWLLDGDFWVADANIQSIVNEKWTLPADMNLCLGHNTLWMDKTGPFAGEYDIVVPAGITLNIYGCEDSAMARIVGEHAGFLTVDGGTVNVYGGKLVGEGDGQIIVNSGELNLIGGTITSDDGLNGTSSNDCVLVVKGGTVNISGGTVEATGKYVDFDTQEDVGATGIRVSGGKLNLTGAPAFKCEGADLEVNTANAVDANGYTGGKLTVKVGENLAVGDVVVSHAAEAAFEAEGAYVDESGNLVVGEPIPEGHYHDGVLFQEWNPVDCYKGGNWLLDGDFWVADANIQSIVNEKWTLPADMNLCLGHNTLWMDKTGPFAGEYDIVVPAGITLNIYGCEDSAMARIVGEHAGFLTVDGGTVNVYGGKLVGEGDGQIIVNSGELNLIGGTITSDDGLNGTSSNDCVLVVKGGTVNISGGTVEATGKYVDFDTQEDVGATGIRVSGGKLNLTGAPAFKCEGADLEVNAANAVDADGYTGGKLTVKVGENLAAGDVVVSHATEATFEAEGAYINDNSELVVGEIVVHVLTKVDAVDSTCKKAGHKEYWTCSHCDLLFADAAGTVVTTLDEVTLPLVDHTYGEWMQYTDTQHQRQCPVCYTYEREAHKWDEGVVDGCTTTYTCSVCQAQKFEHQHGDVEFKPLSATFKGGNFPANGNYFLTQDVVLTSNITIKASQTIGLCLNGHKIDGGTKYYIIVDSMSGNGGTLDIWDCMDNTGEIYATINSSNGIVTNTGGTLNIHGGRITNNGTGYAVYAKNNGQTDDSVTNIDGGIITSAGTSASSGYAVYAPFSSSGITAGRSVKVNISGGEFKSNYRTVFASFPDVHISGGTFTTTSATEPALSIWYAGSVSVSGGTFTAPAYAIKTNPANGNMPSLYLSGNPVLNGGVADLYQYQSTQEVPDGKIYATDRDGVNAYTGAELTVDIAPTIEAGEVVVYNVNDANQNSFTLVTEGMALTREGNNLVVADAVCEHVWGEPSWHVDVDNTATATFTCTKCGESQTVDANVDIDYVEPGCETTGSETVVASVNFNGVDYLMRGETTVIPAQGHDWGEWVVTKQPAEGVKGEETRTCNRCGETETRDIPALAHVHEDDKSFETPVTSALTEWTEGSYYLSEDVTASRAINVSGHVQLCLNGHTLALGAYTINVQPGAVLDIHDCGETGLIKTNAANNLKALTVSGGTVNVYGGTIEAVNTNGSGLIAIELTNSAVCNVYGGVVRATSYGIKATDSTVNVSGGAVEALSTGMAYIIHLTNCESSVTGGVLKSGMYGICAAANTRLTISGEADITAAGRDALQVTGDGAVVHVTGGTLTANTTGGTAANPPSGIFISKGDCYLTGGTVTAKEGVRISDSGTGKLHLGGAPVINGTDADILVYNQSQVSAKANDAAYTGETLKVGVYASRTMTEGQIVVTDVTDAGKFTMDPYGADGLVLRLEGTNLVLGQPVQLHEHDGIVFDKVLGNDLFAGDETQVELHEGNYILEEDVTVSKKLTIYDNVNICLNGHKLTTQTDNKWSFNVAEGADVNVYDCGDGVWSTGYYSTSARSSNVCGTLTLNEGLRVEMTRELPFMVEGTMNIKGAELVSVNSGNPVSTGIIRVWKNGTLNVYEGSSITSDKSYPILATGGTTNIYGGTITGSAPNVPAAYPDRSGAIAVKPDADVDPVVNIYGGTIRGTLEKACAVFMNYRTDNVTHGIVNISGGELLGDRCVYAFSASTISAGDLNVTGGKLHANDVAIVVDNAQVNISGGELTTSSETAPVIRMTKSSVNRGNIHLSGTPTLTDGGLGRQIELAFPGQMDAEGYAGAKVNVGTYGTYVWKDQDVVITHAALDQFDVDLNNEELAVSESDGNIIVGVAEPPVAAHEHDVRHSFGSTQFVTFDTLIDENTTTLEYGKHYYLDHDVTIPGTLTYQSDNGNATFICLNGHTLKVGQFVFGDGSKLGGLINLSSCEPGGKLISDNETVVYLNGGTSRSAILYVNDVTIETLYTGTGTHAAIEKNPVATSKSSVELWGNTKVTGTAYGYRGTNITVKDEAVIRSTAPGGYAVRIDTGFCGVEGGEVYGIRSTGGNSGNYGDISISGGKVLRTDANAGPGAIWAEKGSTGYGNLLNVTGGEIRSNDYGIFLQPDNDNTTYQRGREYAVAISGGTIHGDIDGIRLAGSNSAPSTVLVEGDAVVTGGENGINVSSASKYLRVGVKGATVTGGKYGVNLANVTATAADQQLRLCGNATISGGTADVLVAVPGRVSANMPDYKNGVGGDYTGEVIDIAPATEGALAAGDIVVTNVTEGTNDEKFSYTEELTLDGTNLIVAAAHVHEAAEVTFTWTDDFKATATVKCECGEIMDTIEASVASEVTTEPGETTTGVRTYTATVVVGDKTYTDTKTEEIPALGHVHEGITYDKVLTASMTTWEAGNYYLTGDVTMTGPVTVNGKVNLCLNGHTLTPVTASMTAGIHIGTGAALNVTDCTKDGKISGAAQNYSLIGLSGGTLDVADATIEGTGTSTNRLILLDKTGSTLNIHEGALIHGRTGFGTVISANNGNINMDGGTVDTLSGTPLSKAIGTVNISGGKVDGKIDATAGTLTISGTAYVRSGITATSASSSKTINVNGGEVMGLIDLANGTVNVNDGYVKGIKSGKTAKTYVKGGTVEVGTGHTIDVQDGEVWISGGTLKNDNANMANVYLANNKGMLHVSGGVFENPTGDNISTFTPGKIDAQGYKGAALKTKLNGPFMAGNIIAINVASTDLFQLTGNYASYSTKLTETNQLILVAPHTHTYGEPVWSWNEDKTEATATFACECGEATEVVEATVEVEVTKPDCVNDGETTYTATAEFGGKIYTDVKTETVEALGHETELRNAKDATCTEEGYTGDLVCTVCGETIEQGEAIEALGHNWSEYTETKAPTCEEPGEETRTCSRCEETETREIDALGHKYGEPVWTWNDENEAEAVFTCEHDETHVETVKAVVTEEVTVEPGCETVGEKTYTATVEAGEETYTDTKVEEIPAKGHHYEDGTCTECGQDDPDFLVTMYRVYNPYTQEHLLVSDVNEVENLTDGGWLLDGIAWYSPKTTDVPVYRLYNKYTDMHFYTVSEAEADTLVEGGWLLDGVVCYSTTAEKGVPVYRVYNPYEYVHLFTISESERQTLEDAGWIYEGIAWYAIAPEA